MSTDTKKTLYTLYCLPISCYYAFLFFGYIVFGDTNAEKHFNDKFKKFLDKYDSKIEAIDKVNQSV